MIPLLVLVAAIKMVDRVGYSSRFNRLGFFDISEIS